MRNLRSRWMISLLMLLADWYIFSAIRSVSSHSQEHTKILIYSIFWSLSLVSVLTMLLFPYFQSATKLKSLRNHVFAMLIGLLLSKVVAITIFLADDLRRLLIWLGTLASATIAGKYSDGISRSPVLTWLGIALGSFLFLSLLTGFANKYRYRIRRVRLKFSTLPAGFKGIKIIQISDIHSGSLASRASVNKGVDLILKEEPDLVLFTGDLVNDRAVEMEGLMDVFGRIKAPMGVYSVLGNHDYGDYYWGVNPTGPRAVEKRENLDQLKQVHKDLGWRLLMNEHVILKRKGDEIALLGIENWGAKAGFPKYGNMSAAYPGTEMYRFKILMSHDPSHWQAEVTTKYPDINLTLSGHTHGMQFGFELPWIKWSPVQWVYKQWAGLYGSGEQRLYVNRGFGFLGYPGRVGILPEITVFELL